MPLCDGRPNIVPCPHISEMIIQYCLSQSDLMLCAACEKARFPYLDKDRRQTATDVKRADSGSKDRRLASDKKDSSPAISPRSHHRGSGGTDKSTATAVSEASSSPSTSSTATTLTSAKARVTRNVCPPRGDVTDGGVSHTSSAEAATCTDFSIDTTTSASPVVCSDLLMYVNYFRDSTGRK